MAVQSASKDTLILAKLHFFTYIVGTLKPFLTQYQSTKPMISFLYDDLYQLLRDIVSEFIKPDILESVKAQVFAILTSTAQRINSKTGNWLWR